MFLVEEPGRSSALEGRDSKEFSKVRVGCVGMGLMKLVMGKLGQYEGTGILEAKSSP